MSKEFLLVEKNQYYPAGDASFYEINFRQRIRLPNGATVSRYRASRKFVKGDSIIIRYLDSVESSVLTFDELWLLFEGNEYEGHIQGEKVIFEHEATPKVSVVSNEIKKKDYVEEEHIRQHYYARQMTIDITPSIVNSGNKQETSKMEMFDGNIAPMSNDSEINPVRKAGLVVLYIIAGICLALIVINVLVATVSNLVLLVGYLAFFGVGAAILVLLINLLSGKGKD